MVTNNFCQHIPANSTVVVGMSGGVDSSVSAALLKEQGFSVIGMFMKNWEETTDDGICTTHEDYQDVIKVCDQLKIPHYAVNFAAEYRDQVFGDFLEKLKSGNTPNPDILCNREIKFKLLLDAARKLGASALATGHYAQNRVDDGKFYLTKGLDPGKDQTYFLYTLNQAILPQVLFPVGGILKSEVRLLAKKFGLSTAEKKDSTGICFIGERNFRDFLNNYLPYQPGNFETLAKKVIAKHQGIAYYTVGQRRGLAIGGPGEAWFVVGKDVERNVVYVEQGELHPALFSDTLIAEKPSWVLGNGPSILPYSCKAKIRYRQPDQACIIEKIEGDKMHVRFSSPQRAITPEQSVVFYQDTICLGGATIVCRGPSYFEEGRAVPENLAHSFS
jgi:tRNA-uridine 2-sulfurtransferase